MTASKQSHWIQIRLHVHNLEVLHTRQYPVVQTSNLLGPGPQRLKDLLSLKKASRKVTLTSRPSISPAPT